MNPLTISLGIAAVVLFVLLLSSKSNQDFPLGDEQGRWSGDDNPDTQVNSQNITLDSANAEKLRRLDEAVGNWDNETTGY